MTKRPIDSDILLLTMEIVYVYPYRSMPSIIRSLASRDDGPLPLSGRNCGPPEQDQSSMKQQLTLAAFMFLKVKGHD
jgi:hypothetical protein